MPVVFALFLSPAFLTEQQVTSMLLSHYVFFRNFYRTDSVIACAPEEPPQNSALLRHGPLPAQAHTLDPFLFPGISRKFIPSPLASFSDAANCVPHPSQHPHPSSTLGYPPPSRSAHWSHPLPPTAQASSSHAPFPQILLETIQSHQQLALGKILLQCVA